MPDQEVVLVPGKSDYMSVSRELIENIDYWRRLNPGSKISNQPWPTDCDQVIFSDSDIETAKLSLIKEGYFQTSPCIPEWQLERLITCTNLVMAEGHAPVYALLYDDFFEVLASIKNLLRSLLGANFRIVPDEPDVYFIPTSNTHTGAEPHRDTLRSHDMYDSKGLPSVINVWIPITDATTLNSCIHVIPAFADPDFRTTKSDELLPRMIDSSCLQNVRALPATAGSILGWSTELLHWGGQSSSRAKMPRLSFAMYFQNAANAKIHPTATPVPFHLDFEYRLYLIEKVWRDSDGYELNKFL